MTGGQHQMELLFDQGTLVLTEAPDLSRKAIPGLLWDPRVELYRAPAYRYAQVVEALRMLRLPLTDEVERSGAAPADQWRSVELRPYQQAAVLCIDQERGCSDAELPKDAKIIRYRRRIDVRAVLAVL